MQSPAKSYLKVSSKLSSNPLSANLLLKRDVEFGKTFAKTCSIVNATADPNLIHLGPDMLVVKYPH